ncbi:hypothetical protein WG922_00290 [Ramlibacter sp. AN1015]|uniref:hypothetical protein n=1 Tax=Ramlibacter sp. AN1015 TaxID=3133428 RepID=UPI0030C4A46F
MIDLKLRLVAVACAAVLAACGGGGGGDDAQVEAEAAPETANEAAEATNASLAEKLVGTYVGCTPIDATTSARSTHTTAAGSNTELPYTFLYEKFPTPDCSGTRTGGYTQAGGKVQLSGVQVEVDGIKAEKIVLVLPNFSTFGSVSLNTWPTGNFKQVASIQGGKLRIGDRQQLGADGYPTRLSSTVFTKQ